MNQWWRDARSCCARLCVTALTVHLTQPARTSSVHTLKLVNVLGECRKSSVSSGRSGTGTCSECGTIASGAAASFKSASATHKCDLLAQQRAYTSCRSSHHNPQSGPAGRTPGLSRRLGRLPIRLASLLGSVRYVEQGNPTVLEQMMVVLSRYPTTMTALRVASRPYWLTISSSPPLFCPLMSAIR